MANPLIGERTVELEQGLDELQRQVDERAAAPQAPVTKPAITGGSTPFTVITSKPAPPEPEAPAEDHPTWDEVAATPEYQSASPESKLVAFSRWHDETYNLLSKTPEWDSIKKDFNTGAAKKEQELILAAGGKLPDPTTNTPGYSIDDARLKIAQDKLRVAAPDGDIAKLSKAEIRDTLKPLGMDVVHAYYNQPHQALTKAMFNSLVQGGVEGAASTVTGLAASPQIGDLDNRGISTEAAASLAGAQRRKLGAQPSDADKKFAELQKSLGIEPTAKATPESDAVARLKWAQQSKDPLVEWARQAPEKIEKQFPVSDENKNKFLVSVAKEAGGFAPIIAAGPVGPFVMGMQSAGEHMTHDYNELIDQGMNPEQAARQTMQNATAAGLTTEAIWAVLPAPLRKVGDKFLVEKFGTAPLQKFIMGRGAQAGEGYALGAASRIAENTISGKPTLEGVHEAGSGMALLMAVSPRGAHEAAAEGVAEKITEAGDAAAEKAKAANSPEVAEAVKEVTQQQAGEVKQLAAEVPLNRGKEEAAPGENNITITREPDADGEIVPKMNIPEDATAEHLNEARQEVLKTTKKDSADQNELLKQIDEALVEKNKAYAPAEEAIPAANAPVEEAPKKTRVIDGITYTQGEDGKLQAPPDVVAKREKMNEQHVAFRTKQNPEAKTAAAKTVTEAIKSGQVKDVTYDGRGFFGEQFTEIDPNIPGHSATFEVPTNATLEEFNAKREAVRKTFVPEEPIEAPESAPTPRELSKDEKAAVNKEAYAKAQEAKRAAGNKPDFNVNAEFERQRAQLTAERQSAPPKEITKPGEKATRAERSAFNKAEHKRKQQEASAARKAARAAEGVNEPAKKQTTVDVIKRGYLPTDRELKKAHPELDITTRADLRRELHAKLQAEYPPEEVPKGSTVTHVPHDYTHEDLPVIETKDADGVTRTRPQFTNDPEITAQQKDLRMFSDEKGDRLYIPDELIDEEKVNPAIFNLAKWDPEAQKYYVGAVDTTLGRVELSHEEAVAQQERVVSRKDVNDKEADTEQRLSYTQLRKENDAFGKAHQHVLAGDHIDAINEAVNGEAGRLGIDEDSISNHDEGTDEGGRPDHERAPEPADSKTQSKTDELLAQEQLREAKELGLTTENGKQPKLTDVIDKLIADSKTPNWTRLILNLIRRSGIAKTNKINIEVVSAPDEYFAGRFYHSTNTIKINVAGGWHGKGGVRATFMHELFHGILDYKMEPTSARNEVEQRAYIELNKLYDQVSRHFFKQWKDREPATDAELEAWQQAQYAGEQNKTNDWAGRNYYALSNTREFITETMTNPDWQGILAGADIKLPELGKSRFGGIVDTIKSNIKNLFAGSEVTKTSPLDHALEHMFTLVEEGYTKAGMSYVDRVAETKRRQVEIEKYRKGDFENVRDRDRLTRAERSVINKEAYRRAQEEAKRQGAGFDVMKEYERQRDRLIDAFVRGSQTSNVFTTEGRAKMKDAAERATARAEAGLRAKEETGLTPSELNDEISGAELDFEPEPKPEKPVIHLYDKVYGNGWVTPEGKYLPVEEFYHQGITAGHNPLQFGGHGSHGSAAWEYIQSQPEMAADFAKAAERHGYTNIDEMTEGDVKDFLESRGFLRVLHDQRRVYFTGDPRKNRAGVRLLEDFAINEERTLAHDTETLGSNSIKKLYEPPTMVADSAPASAPEVEPKDEETAKVRYIQRAGGRRNISIEGVPNKAQVEATFREIDADSGASDTVKTALKDQMALAAKQQAPVLVEKVQLNLKNPLTGKVVTTVTAKDTGADIVVAGANSAVNIPRIVAEQGSNRVAQDFGSLKKPSKEVAMDRKAMTVIVDEGRDLHALEIARDRVANSKRVENRALAAIYDHAIAAFDRLKDKTAHDKEMKAVAEREQTYGIPTPMLENYVSRIFESRDVSDNAVIAVPNGQGGTRYFTKARSYEKLSDAIHDGLVPETMDIVDLDRRRIEAGERLIQQKILHESLKAVHAADGRPIISTPLPEQTLYRGERMDTPRGYQLVNVPGGGSIVVHNDYAPLMEALYGKSYTGRLAKWAGFMKKNTLILDSFHVGRIMFKEAAYSKGMARLGYQKGLSILEYSKSDLGKALELGDISKQEHDYAMEHYEDAQALIRNGLNVGSIADNMNAEIIRGIPYLRNFNPWVFSKLSRGAMLQTALANLERNQARFGELSRDEVLRRTSKEMNEVFGNLNMQSIIKNKQFQSSLRAILLAPQWTESQLKSELRGYGQILKAPIDVLRGDFRVGVVAQGQITAVLGTFMAMQVASVLMNGKTTFQNDKGGPLTLHIPILGDKRHSFEFNPFEIAGEYAFMAYRYHSQHMQLPDIAQRIAFNKLGPVAHGAVNFVLNRDYAGRRYASKGDRYRAALESFIPLPPLFGAGLERDPRSFPGIRVTRQPGAIQKTLMQSSGVKVSYSQTPRGEMFALAQPFRDDKDYGDNSPPIYRELRTALDNRDEGSIQTEIRRLAADGKTEDQIREAVGITHGGIKPEKFTKKADVEKIFIKMLTPEQRKTYNEAQADHKTNANLLRATLSQMKIKDTEFANQLRKNHRKPKVSDFQN